MKRPRPNRGLAAAMHTYLVTRGTPATISEIQAGVAERYPDVPRPSVRGGLQNPRLFERVSRGMFRAKL